MNLCLLCCLVRFIYCSDPCTTTKSNGMKWNEMKCFDMNGTDFLYVRHFETYQNHNTHKMNMTLNKFVVRTSSISLEFFAYAICYFTFCRNNRILKLHIIQKKSVNVLHPMITFTEIFYFVKMHKDAHPLCIIHLLYKQYKK